MKLFKYFLSTLLAASMAQYAVAQAPGLINYQAVARNSAGDLMTGTIIGVRLTIHDGSTTGSIQYQETHTVTTNAYGLFNLEIGAGTATSGNMSSVTWGSGSKYLEVEIDPTGGSSYTSMGAQQLVSVPYAMSAATAANAGSLSSPLTMSGDVTGNNSATSVVKIQGQNLGGAAPSTGQVLQWNGTAWNPATMSSSTGTVTSITAGTGLSGGTITTSGTISLPNVGTAGTYGSATQVPVITTDAQGRVSSVTNTTITGDNWGTQTATTDLTLGGNGTTATPLKIAQHGATTGQVLQWNGTTWLPASVSGVGTVTSVTAGAGLSGGTFTSSGTISMPNVGTAGTYGTATQVPIFTTDAQGRVTSVTNTTIPVGVTSISTSAPLTGGPITGTGTIGLATTGTAGTYGSGTSVPVITTDAYGRVTGVTTSPVSVASVTMGGDVTGSSSAATVAKLRGTNISTTAPTANQFLQYNSGTTSWTPTTVTIPTFSGTANYLPKFTSATNVGNSVLYQSSTSSMLGVGTTTPIASLEMTTTDSIVGYLHSTSAIQPRWGIIRGDYLGTSSSTTNYGIGVTGWARQVPTNNNTMGVAGYGTNTGVFGYANSTSTSSSVLLRGLEGAAYGDAGSVQGVFGMGQSSTGTPDYCYGLVGNASGGSVNYSGYFVGDVYVGGTLSKAGGTFKIDHPQDPENKYLVHSFVESPDMMNVYNGNITTDATGVATVELPTYFESLNKDFRYQLTVISGDFAQAIVGQKVHDNKFVIKTNMPNVEVSWQVTGIRKDAWANAHRVQAEVEKESFNKGKYLDAKDLNKPASQQIGAQFTAPNSSKVATGSVQQQAQKN